MSTSGLSFAALRHPGFRIYFITSAMAMMADSIEHVISYWMLFQKFHSPELGGFAVISHWVPYLLFAVWSGALADRFDPRRLVQLGMGIFMLVSLAWGVLFLTGWLEVWHAVVLLTIHGMAGVFWGPPGQLLLHHIVGREQLQSAVRLNATSRYLGLLMGPAVGGVLMLWLGPTKGIFLNVLIYLPLVLWLWKAPYGPRFSNPQNAAPARAGRGYAEILATMREVAGHRTIVSMILLAGGASLFIGNAYQAQMPEFAQDLGHGDPGFAYSMLLGADAAGALVAGLALEARGLLQARSRTAFLLAMGWCCTIAAFAASPWYGLSVLLLFMTGFLELSFNSMAQTLVQLNAPAAMRGRVIGLYSMSALGMRAFAGVTVGVVGGLIGIHWSLALSAMALLALIAIVAGLSVRPRPATADSQGRF